MAVFPTEIAEFIPVPIGLATDPVQPADYTGIRNEIVAIEEELGVNPAGELPTLAQRLGVQFSEANGWRKFEFGSITNSFASPQTVTFTGGRFTTTPQFLAINATGFAAAGEPAIFCTLDESEIGLSLKAYTRTGATPSTSATVIWMAYLPAVDRNEDEEGAEDGGGGIPPAGVEPSSRIVDGRPYYYDRTRNRYLSYETAEFVWVIDATGIVADQYLDVGTLASSAGPIPILETMVLVELSAINAGSSSSTSEVELRDNTASIADTVLSLDVAGTVLAGSYNVEIPAGTLLQAHLKVAGGDSIDTPLVRARLKYLR